MEDVDLTPGSGVGVELNRFLDQIPQALSRLSTQLRPNRTPRPCYQHRLISNVCGDLVEIPLDLIASEEFV